MKNSTPNKKLNANSRELLSSLIVQQFVENNINMVKSTFLEIKKQITLMFPDEDGVSKLKYIYNGNSFVV